MWNYCSVYGIELCVRDAAKNLRCERSGFLNLNVCAEVQNYVLNNYPFF